MRRNPRRHGGRRTASPPARPESPRPRRRLSPPALRRRALLSRAGCRDPLRGTVEIRFRVPQPPVLPAPRHDHLGRNRHRPPGFDPRTARRSRARPRRRPALVLLADGGLARRADVAVGLAGIGQGGNPSRRGGWRPGHPARLRALDGDSVRIRAPRKPKVGGVQVPQGFSK